MGGENSAGTGGNAGEPLEMGTLEISARVRQQRMGPIGPMGLICGAL
jgi:hypothetical protein